MEEKKETKKEKRKRVRLLPLKELNDLHKEICQSVNLNDDRKVILEKLEFVIDLINSQSEAIRLAEIVSTYEISGDNVNFFKYLLREELKKILEPKDE